MMSARGDIGKTQTWPVAHGQCRRLLREAVFAVALRLLDAILMRRFIHCRPGFALRLYVAAGRARRLASRCSDAGLRSKLFADLAFTWLVSRLLSDSSRRRRGLSLGFGIDDDDTLELSKKAEEAAA